ncbi:Hypothetical predicted protein, partial [Pelobates cultripes]
LPAPSGMAFVMARGNLSRASSILEIYADRNALNACTVGVDCSEPTIHIKIHNLMNIQWIYTNGRSGTKYRIAVRETNDLSYPLSLLVPIPELDFSLSYP